MLVALKDIARILTPTDPSKFSADDERRRIGTVNTRDARNHVAPKSLWRPMEEQTNLRLTGEPLTIEDLRRIAVLP